MNKILRWLKAIFSQKIKETAIQKDEYIQWHSKLYEEEVNRKVKRLSVDEFEKELLAENQKKLNEVISQIENTLRQFHPNLSEDRIKKLANKGMCCKKDGYYVPEILIYNRECLKEVIAKDNIWQINKLWIKK